MRPRLFKGEYRTSINIYLSEGQKEQLTALARNQGISPSAVVRNWIESEAHGRSTVARG